MPPKQHLLTITFIGPYDGALARAITVQIADRGCDIMDCRFAQIGDQLCANVLVNGNWSSLGRLETALPGIAEELGIQFAFERSEPRELKTELRPYAVDIIAPATTGLLREVLDYFKGQSIDVVEIVGQNYAAQQTGADMASIQLVVHVPLNTHPPTLRESFMDLCDDLHADGLLDPIKN